MAASRVIRQVHIRMTEDGDLAEVAVYGTITVSDGTVEVTTSESIEDLADALTTTERTALQALFDGPITNWVNRKRPLS